MEQQNNRMGAQYGPSSTENSTQEKQRVLSERAKEEASRVYPYITNQKQQFAQQLNDTAKVLHETSSKLPNNISTDFVRLSGEKIGRFGDYLEGHNIDEIMEDAQGYARVKPWMVMSGAFVIGMAAVRFLKSSGQQARSESMNRPAED